MEELKTLEEDKAKIAQSYLLDEAKKIEAEKRRKLGETITHLLNVDLRTILTEVYGSQEMMLFLEIKKIQYLEKIAEKMMGDEYVRQK